MSERTGRSESLGAVMARLRARWNIPHDPDGPIYVNSVNDCWQCGKLENQPAGEGCKNPKWHDTRIVVIDPEGQVLQQPGVNPNCPQCHGRAWLRRDVGKDDPEFGKLVRCPECFGPAEDRRVIAAQLAGLPKGHQGMLLGTWPGKPEHVVNAKDWLSRLHANPDETPWLVIHGPRGVGKTGLAVGIMRSLLDERRQVMFLLVANLLDRIRATFHPDSPISTDTLWDGVLNVDTLVLDDLGAQRNTAWVEEKLFELFDHRYANRLVTIVTMNPLPDSIASQSEQMGRIVDRMAEVADVMEIPGPNLRQR